MGAIILLAALIAQTSPAQQTSTPPPTIVNVQSKSRVCAALQQSIGPSIAGLMQNDRWIVEGMYEIDAMGHDSGTLREKMDELHLENDVSKIVRNLGAVDHLLKPAPDASASPDEVAKIEAMKKRLRDVVWGQLMTLNKLDGDLESSQLAGLLDAPTVNFSDPMQQGMDESRHDAIHRKMMLAASPGPSLPNGLGDFFPALLRTENTASAEIVAGAAGCKPVDHRLELPH